MKFTRFLLVLLTLSLAACGTQITGPDSVSSSQDDAPNGIGTLGSGT